VNLPNCTVYKIDIGGQVCGFENIDDWKLVLKADADLTDARAKLKNEQAVEADLIKQRDLLNVQLAAYADSQSILIARHNKLTDDLIALDKKYQEERVKPQWGNPIAWTIAAVSTAVLLGVVLDKAL
jgi:hypothetical protein